MAKRRLLYFALIFFSTLPFSNCSSPTETATPLFPFETSGRYYFQDVQRLTMEVYYELAAEPFTGNSPQGRPYWNILKENLAAIFQYRSIMPTLNIPTTKSAMTAIPDQNRAQWTSADILALSEQFRQALPDSQSGRIYVYFVNGNFANESGVQSGVIGVNIRSTPIIVLFKDVIQNSGLNPAGPVPKFVEQSTLVHEMGHALGFVNLGVPMSSAHEDGAHAGHTMNQDCVMYWLNEGASDLSQFVQRFITSSSLVMWGPQVLADAQAFSR